LRAADELATMHGVRFAAADAPVETRIEASTVDIRGTQPEPV